MLEKRIVETREEREIIRYKNQRREGRWIERERGRERLQVNEALLTFWVRKVDYSAPQRLGEALNSSPKCKQALMLGVHKSNGCIVTFLD